MSFESQKLLLQLKRLIPTMSGRYLVAFSGGCDSQVLLHAMAEISELLARPLVAVHINHGLQSGAQHWEKHCEQFCEARGIPCEVIDLALMPQPGESIEAVARAKRYQALQALMNPGDCLLTAHHQDDQAETLLLQLFRGCGIDGLAAMPEAARFGKGLHVRPLLPFTRAELEEYATDHGLVWVEDTSNLDRRFDRNFVRHAVMPLLEQRWPGIKGTLSRSASHCAEAQQLIESVAAQDLLTVLHPERGTLDQQVLLSLSSERRNALMRQWFKSSGCRPPSTAKLQSIVTDLLESAADRCPVVRWSDVEVRRYKGEIYLLPATQPFDSRMEIRWEKDRPLFLPGGLGVLHLKPAVQGISRQYWQEGRVSVGFRQDGMRCRPVGRGGSRSVKKLLQELCIPPWERDRYPLVFIDGELAAVGTTIICEPFMSAPGEDNVVLDWELPSPELTSAGSSPG